MKNKSLVSFFLIALFAFGMASCRNSPDVVNNSPTQPYNANEGNQAASNSVKVTLSPTPASTNTPAPYSGLPAQYTVRSWIVNGDCLWNIAAQPWAYNDASKWRLLYIANKNKLPDPNNPDLIRIGMVLDIPSINGEERQGMWNRSSIALSDEEDRMMLLSSLTLSQEESLDITASPPASAGLTGFALVHEVNEMPLLASAPLPEEDSLDIKASSLVTMISSQASDFSTASEASPVVSVSPPVVTSPPTPAASVSLISLSSINSQHQFFSETEHQKIAENTEKKNLPFDNDNIIPEPVKFVAITNMRNEPWVEILVMDHDYGLPRRLL